jgi:hypothetical protein
MSGHDRQQADEAHGEVPTILSANGKAHVSNATYRQNGNKHISSASRALHKMPSLGAAIRALRVSAASLP